MVINERVLAEYIKEGREFRDDAIRHMAATTVEIRHFNEYVTTCEKDRESQSGRVAAIESKQKSNENVIKSWVFGVPILSGIITWIIKHSDKL